MGQESNRIIPNKKNLIWMIVSIGVLVACIVSFFFIPQTIATIVLLIGITSLVCLFVNWSRWSKIRKKNKQLEQLKYGFDYEQELFFHSVIGRDGKNVDKEVARNQYVFKSAEDYTSWKKQVLDRHKICDEQSDCRQCNKDACEYINRYINFKRFLNQMLRDAKDWLDVLKTIVVPVELALVAGLLGTNGQSDSCNCVSDIANGLSAAGTMIAFVITLTTCAMIMIKEMVKTKDEIYFLQDIMDVLFSEERMNGFTEGGDK